MRGDGRGERTGRERAENRKPGKAVDKQTRNSWTSIWDTPSHDWCLLRALPLSRLPRETCFPRRSPEINTRLQNID